jgi:hypothetical protein
MYSFKFQTFIDDTVNSLVHQVKSGSFSIQENRDDDRNERIQRRSSVLDEKALREDDTELIRDQRIHNMCQSYQVILESIGEDPSRQGNDSFIKFVNLCFS